MKDLTRSKVDLQAYTLKNVMFIIPLMENHLSELLAIGEYLNEPEKFLQAWENTLFCAECLQRHGGELGGYALECVRGSCIPLSTWRNLANLGSEIYDFFSNHRTVEDYQKKETYYKTQEYVTRIRALRKELTGDDGIKDGHIVD